MTRIDVPFAICRFRHLELAESRQVACDADQGGAIERVQTYRAARMVGARGLSKLYERALLRNYLRDWNDAIAAIGDCDVGRHIRIGVAKFYTATRGRLEILTIWCIRNEA